MRSAKDKARIRGYWEKNIAGFAGFYDKTSEEDFEAHFLVKRLYKTFILPIEKKYMRDRYNLVAQFIEENAKPKMTAADIGCGSGIYTKLLANRCDKVYAIDYARSAIDLTTRSLSPAEIRRVEMLVFDITMERIPDVDVAISIGVLPYIPESDQFLLSILPHTKRLLFNYLDERNLCNRVRKALPILNVRHYSYHNLEAISSTLEDSGFMVNEIYKLATGFVIDAKKTGFV